MTNKEILQANLLDIIFEHRNKNYGAYALRKTYPQRLQWSVIIAVALASLLFLVNLLKKEVSFSKASKGEIILSEYVDKTKEPERPVQKPQQSTATVKATTIRIANAPTDVPDNDALETAKPGTETHEGTAATLDTTAATPTQGTANAPLQTAQPEVILSQHEAEFPGGKEAFAQFLRDRLNTPDELEAGQRQTVLVRFVVDVDGSISKAEIVQSGGNTFDREVLRVLKKMPRWKPAEQNGVKVPVYFTQVVTFVGLEQ